MSLAFDNSEYPAPPAPLQTDTLVDSVLILLALNVVQRLVGFVRAVLFCRWLDAEQLGLWDMAFSFLLLAAPLAVLAIPGAFGRYLEHYRQRGQLRTFLRRTILACGGLAMVAFAVVLLAAAMVVRAGLRQRRPVGHDCPGGRKPGGRDRLQFPRRTVHRPAQHSACVGDATGQQRGLCRVGRRAAAGLAMHGRERAALLRRIVSDRGRAGRLRVAAGVACRAAGRPDRCRAACSGPASAPFAAWVLLGSVLTNLFGVVDRYMIVHFSRMSADEALDAVGNYYAARVVPLLLVSIAAMLGTMITPHLSHDWEAGRRDLVVARLRLFLKLFGFALFAAAAVVLRVRRRCCSTWRSAGSSRKDRPCCPGRWSTARGSACR